MNEFIIIQAETIDVHGSVSFAVRHEFIDLHELITLKKLLTQIENNYRNYKRNFNATHYLLAQKNRTNYLIRL